MRRIIISTGLGLGFGFGALSRGRSGECGLEEEEDLQWEGW